MWVLWFRNVIWIFEPVAFGLVSVKSVVVFFSLSIHKRLIPVLPSTLPAVQHLTGANVETKTCTLGFFVFFLRVGPRARGCQHQVQCVFVDCANGWAAPHLISHHWEVKSFNIHLLLRRPWDDEVCWIVLLLFFIPGELIAEFHGGVLWGC